jgi:hypothetical protein
MCFVTYYFNFILSSYVLRQIATFMYIFDLQQINILNNNALKMSIIIYLLINSYKSMFMLSFKTSITYNIHLLPLNKVNMLI